MLYRLLKILMRLTLRGYFKRITVKGLGQIPTDVPVIFAPNHPSAFMDPILVASIIHPQVYFMAAGEAFNNPVLAWIYKQMHMIPVYRPAIQPELTHKNEEVFEKCFHHMEQKGTMIIFPEGNSKTEYRLRKIKTGIARIVMGAEARNDWTLGTVVVPVGLNYTNPHRFQSEVFVNFSEPIKATDFRSGYERDNRKAVTDFTEQIKHQLEQSTIVIREEAIGQMIRQITIMYRAQLKEELGIEKDEREQDFTVTKEISEAVHQFYQTDPELVNQLRTRIEDYFDKMNHLGLSDFSLKSGQQSARGSLTFAIIGAPAHLYGWVTHIIPFKVTGWIADLMHVREDFFGSILIAVGMLAYLLWYAGLLVGFAIIAGVWWWTVLFGVSLPLSGLFTLHYVRNFRRIRGTWHLLRIFHKRNKQVAEVIQQRKRIISDLEEAKDKYFERLPS